jgi:hypothetical protein
MMANLTSPGVLRVASAGQQQHQGSIIPAAGSSAAAVAPVLPDQSQPAKWQRMYAQGFTPWDTHTVSSHLRWYMAARCVCPLIAAGTGSAPGCSTVVHRCVSSVTSGKSAQRASPLQCRELRDATLLTMETCEGQQQPADSRAAPECGEPENTPETLEAALLSVGLVDETAAAGEGVGGCCRTQGSRLRPQRPQVLMVAPSPIAQRHAREEDKPHTTSPGTWSGHALGRDVDDASSRHPGGPTGRATTKGGQPCPIPSTAEDCPVCRAHRLFGPLFPCGGAAAAAAAGGVHADEEKREDATATDSSSKNSGLAVLELGCGTGASVVAMAAHCWLQGRPLVRALPTWVSVLPPTFRLLS